MSGTAGVERAVVERCVSIISSSCSRIAACACVLATVGCVLCNGTFSTRGFPNTAREIFLAKPGVISFRGNSPRRCFSRLFWRNSLISSTSSWAGMRQRTKFENKKELFMRKGKRGLPFSNVSLITAFGRATQIFQTRAGPAILTKEGLPRRLIQ